MLKKTVSIFIVLTLLISCMSLSIASQQSQGTKKAQGTIVKKNQNGETKTIIFKDDSGKNITLIAKEDMDLGNVEKGNKVNVKYTPRNHVIKSIDCQSKDK
ncbi:MAG: hypothetical protein ACOCZ2_01525 [Thermodesulfobacteriota bacterium]